MRSSAVKKTKEMMQIFDKLSFRRDWRRATILRWVAERYAVRRHFKKALLFVAGKECDAIKAARNIPGVDACTVSDITVGKLAPGGSPGRQTLWSEDAVRSIEKSMAKIYPHK